MIVRLNILLFIFEFLTFTTNCFAQRTNEWEVLHSPTNDVLRKLFFVDPNNGWATGLAGTIVYTSDGGNSWILQNSNVTTPIVDVFFINNNKGWALTYPQAPPFGTTVLTTTDGGLNWFNNTAFFENEIMYTVFFFDDTVGFLGGNGIKKTTDGGLTWFNSFIEPGGVSTLPINNFSFYSNTFGYASGGRVDVAGVVWKTTDGGNTWSSIGLSPDQIFDVFLFDSLNALALSGDPEGFFGIGLLKTSNAGLSWSFTELPIFGLSFSIDFLNSQEGWSASGYKFLHSVDGGETWFEELTPDSTVIYDLQFVDKYTGFACGQDGALLKFTSFKKPTVSKPTFELLQNFPNPFSEKTTIGFTVLSQNIDIPTRVKIKLFDVLGNELATLVEDEFWWGRYEYEFNPLKENLTLSSGVYILSLISGDTFISKKMIYLK
ncbi:MAG: YCF48-related protein [Ignavibacteria bacterium]|nr:YCF48-related protein [Ignavibacteria bacterium]